MSCLYWCGGPPCHSWHNLLATKGSLPPPHCLKYHLLGSSSATVSQVPSQVKSVGAYWFIDGDVMWLSVKRDILDVWANAYWDPFSTFTPPLCQKWIRIAFAANETEKNRANCIVSVNLKFLRSVMSVVDSYIGLLGSSSFETNLI